MEILTIIYLVTGLPFAYVWTGEEYKKNTESAFYSNRYSRNYWFSYVLMFCFAVLFYPVWLLVRMMKKAVEKRRWERQINNMSIVELGREEKRLIGTSTPDQWSDAVKKVEKVKALRLNLLSAVAHYPEPKIKIDNGPTFQEKVYHFNHKNRQNSVDKRREHFYNRKFHKGRGKV